MTGRMKGLVLNIVKWAVVLSCCFVGGECAKILFSAAVDTGTHMSSMTSVINRLAEDGHDVTVFETSSLKKTRKFDSPNVQVVFIQVPQNKKNNGLFAELIFRREIRANILWKSYAIGDAKAMEFMRNSENVTTLRNIINTKWDLVIIDELFGVHSFAIVMNLKKYRNTPYIIYATTQMIHTTIHNLALGRNLVSEPYLLTKLPHDESDVYSASRLFDRLDNIWNMIMDLYYVDYKVSAHYTRSVVALDAGKFSFHRLVTESSWIFTEYVARLRYALSEGSEIRHVGATCRQAPVITGNLSRFLDDPSSQGTIYIAFGSYIDWTYAPQSLIDSYFDALEAFPDYRVVFTYNGPAPIRPPSAHIWVTAWAPQLEILAHSKTRIFVSHGGLKSWKETLCNSVPVVYMPVFAEQSYNTKLALRMGYARILNKFHVNSAQIIDALRTVLDDYASFKHNALRARTLFLDRPVNALDEASHAVRRVLRTTARSPDRRDSTTHFARRAIHQTNADALNLFHFALLTAVIWAIC